MIKFDDSADTLLIKCPVSEFVFGMTYCEYKIPFYMQGIMTERKETEMRKNAGREGHTKEEKIEDEKIKKGEIRPVPAIELPWILSDLKCDIEFVREEIATKLSYSTKIDEKDVKLILHGRADKILRKDECLIIQEDKFPQNPSTYVDRRKPFDSHILQALTYLNSKFAKKDDGIKKRNWFDIPHNKKMWVVNIRECNNNLIRSFEGMVEEQDRLYLEEKLFKFISIIVGKKEKTHHNNVKKCIPCEYSKMCSCSMIFG